TRVDYDARSLVAQDQGRRRSRVAARQYSVVERGDACGGDTDKDSLISQRGSWYLDELQVSVSGERLRPHRFHDATSLASPGSWDVGRGHSDSRSNGHGPHEYVSAYKSDDSARS